MGRGGVRRGDRSDTRPSGSHDIVVRNIEGAQGRGVAKGASKCLGRAVVDSVPAQNEAAQEGSSGEAVDQGAERRWADPVVAEVEDAQLAPWPQGRLQLERGIAQGVSGHVELLNGAHRMLQSLADRLPAGTGNEVVLGKERV